MLVGLVVEGDLHGASVEVYLADGQELVTVQAADDFQGVCASLSVGLVVQSDPHVDVGLIGQKVLLSHHAERRSNPDPPRGLPAAKTFWIVKELCCPA